VSPIRQDHILKSHPSVSSITDVLNDAGLSVRRATGTSSNAPPISHIPYSEMSSSWSHDSNNNKSLSEIQFSPSRKRKIVQHGVIHSFPPIVVTLLFQRIPWWLCALDRERVLSIQFPQFASYSDLISALELLEQGRPFISILSSFDSAIFHFQSTRSEHEDLVLVCGSLAFFNTLWGGSTYPRTWIFCTDVHQKWRFLPDFPFQLHRIHHFHHGGPTKFEMLWASSETLSFSTTKLSRTIGDFLDYSIRPKSCSQSPLSKHFKISSVLPVRGLFSPILYPTHFSSSGYGVRPLSASELGHVFGMPSIYLQFFRLEDFPILPTQILDSLIAAWSDLLLRPSHKVRKIDFCVPTPLPVSDSAPVYLDNIQKVLPSTWSLSAPSADKAAKADDAQVARAMWDNRILTIWPSASRLIVALRPLLLRRRRRLLYLEFRNYLQNKYGTIRDFYFDIIGSIYNLIFCNRDVGVSTGSTVSSKVDSFEIRKLNESLRASKYYQLRRDMQVGTKGLHAFCESSFFNWDKGSALFFWRWHPELHRIARDGFPVQISASLPNSFKKSRPPKSEVYKKILSKLSKSLSRGYLVPASFSKIHNLIDFFAVPKAEDIRLVQNGSSCGLNKAIWASNFWLPNASSMTRVLGYNYKAVDIDLGELFLNFPLDKKLVSYSGMDLTPYKDDLLQFRRGSKVDVNRNFYVVNERNWMGLRPSPEWSCRFYYLAEEFIRGNEKEIENPLRWDKVILNLIGNSDFNPALPNVFKWNDKAQRMAGEIKAMIFGPWVGLSSMLGELPD